MPPELRRAGLTFYFKAMQRGVPPGALDQRPGCRVCPAFAPGHRTKKRRAVARLFRFLRIGTRGTSAFGNSKRIVSFKVTLTLKLP